jgi:hypothetical protein
MAEQTFKMPKQDTFNMADLQSLYPVAAAALATDKSLQEALNKIMKLGGANVAPELRLQIIMDTYWYKTNTEQSRLFQMAKTSDPATYAKDLQDNTLQVIRTWAKNGLQIDPANAVQVAENMMKGSVVQDGKIFIYDKNYLNKQMAEAIKFEKTKTLKNGTVVYDFDGELATLSDQLYQMADAYGFKSTVSNKNFSRWFESNLKGLVEGTINPQDVDDELRQRAVSAFPGLTNKITMGQTLRQAADPWLNAIATELELSPDEVDLNDDLVQRALSVQDDKGNFAPMNLRETRLAARRDKRWQYTTKAKEEYTDIGKNLLQSMGFLG